MLINDQTRSSASVRSASAQHTDAHHAITQTLYSYHSSFVFFATRNPVAHAQTRTRRVTYTLLSQRLTRSLGMGRLTPSRLPAGLTAAVAFCSSSPPPARKPAQLNSRVHIDCLLFFFFSSSFSLLLLNIIVCCTTGQPTVSRTRVGDRRAQIAGCGVDSRHRLSLGHAHMKRTTSEPRVVTISKRGRSPCMTIERVPSCSFVLSLQMSATPPCKIRCTSRHTVAAARRAAAAARRAAAAAARAAARAARAAKVARAARAARAAARAASSKSRRSPHRALRRAQDPPCTLVALAHTLATRSGKSSGRRVCSCLRRCRT